MAELTTTRGKAGTATMDKAGSRLIRISREEPARALADRGDAHGRRRKGAELALAVNGTIAASRRPTRTRRPRARLVPRSRGRVQGRARTTFRCSAVSGPASNPTLVALADALTELGGREQLVAQAVQPAAHAAVQAERARLEDEAADQVRVDACASPRPCGPSRPRSVFTIAAASVSESSTAVVSSTSMIALLGGEQALPLGVDLLELADAALLGDEADEVAERLGRALRARRRARRAFASGSICGLRRSRASSSDGRDGAR